MTSSRDGGPPAQQTRRQVVKFTFFKVDSAWRRLPAEERELGKQQFCGAVAAFGDRLLIRSYSLVGMRGDADFLLWQIGDRLEDLQALQTQLFSTGLGVHLSVPYSFLAMTRRSMYVSPEEQARENRLIVQPTDAKYLFVYPFVKTRAWYELPKEERQRMMDQHIAVGRTYPSVKLNTTYSYGLDDQEFMLSFETDQPSDFLDLVMELRETEASRYTLRDTPIFTCIAMSLREALDTLGAPGADAPLPAPSEGDDWTRVATLDELPEGATRVVYARGEQVALFNVGGQVYALGNRCSHANGPLADGSVDGTTVTCPWHSSAFDLRTGQPTGGPAVRPVATYRVDIRDGAIFVRREPAPTPLRPVESG